MRIVPHNGQGFPIDPDYMNYNFLFDGEKFIFFEDAQEQEDYIKANFPQPEEKNEIE
jgi:hypothetical protein